MSIQKTYSRLALSLPPTSGTVPPPQPPQLSDRPPHRDGLNVADRANDLEVHRVKLACRFRPPELSQSPNACLSRRRSRPVQSRSWAAAAASLAPHPVHRTPLEIHHSEDSDSARLDLVQKGVGKLAEETTTNGTT